MNKELMYNILIECGFSIMEIASMTKTELLSQMLDFEGICGYSRWIKDLIKTVYDIDLNKEIG